MTAHLDYNIISLAHQKAHQWTRMAFQEVSQSVESFTDSNGQLFHTMCCARCTFPNSVPRDPCYFDCHHTICRYCAEMLRHPISGRMKCPLCRQVHDQYKAFTADQKQIWNSQLRVLCQYECGYEAGPVDVKLHEEQHCDMRIIKCISPGCQEIGQARDILTTHFNSAHVLTSQAYDVECVEIEFKDPDLLANQENQNPDETVLIDELDDTGNIQVPQLTGTIESTISNLDDSDPTIIFQSQTPDHLSSSQPIQVRFIDNHLSRSDLEEEFSQPTRSSTPILTPSTELAPIRMFEAQSPDHISSAQPILFTILDNHLSQSDLEEDLSQTPTQPVGISTANHSHLQEISTHLSSERQHTPNPTYSTQQSILITAPNQFHNRIELQLGPLRNSGYTRYRQSVPRNNMWNQRSTFSISQGTAHRGRRTREDAGFEYNAGHISARRFRSQQH